MKKLLLAVGALVVAASLAFTMAVAQETTGSIKRSAAAKRAELKTGDPVSKKSLASRTALCKADCLPNNYKNCSTWGCTGMHGLYRTYNQYDPHLVSIQGKKEYAECVQKCLAPLPTVYVQRPIFASGGKWFGKSQTECLDCHVKGHAD